MISFRIHCLDLLAVQRTLKSLLQHHSSKASIFDTQLSFFFFLVTHSTKTFFFNFILFNFTILYWFCHISEWICHRYTCVPYPEPSFLLPPRPSLWVIPVHQPQASSIVHRTWTSDSFHIWYYTCFNAILPNHPTLFLSHRVQKTVLYVNVSFAVSYTRL